MIGIASNSGGGGSSDSGAKKSVVAAKPDCGTPSPQDTVGVVTAYLDGPGSPLVAGKPGCARIAALWARLQVARKAKVAPYVALERAASRTGWALVDSEDPRWRHGNAAFVRSAFAKAGDGQDPLFVFVRPSAAVVFTDLEP